MSRPFLSYKYGDPLKTYIMTQAQSNVPEPAWGTIYDYPLKRSWRISFVSVTQEAGGAARSNFYVETGDGTDEGMDWLAATEALCAAMREHIPRGREWVVQVQVSRVTEESVLQMANAKTPGQYPPPDLSPDEEEDEGGDVDIMPSPT